ncbi:hypothetical protein TNCV_3446361 [Trichonephila clavipes]|nr:hypothetical protein TNCV_3446361 [Trichonephila clavipes]
MATGSFASPNYPSSQSEVLRDHYNWSMRISHKRLTIWKTTFAVLLPIYGHKCWKKVIENWTSRLDYIRASRGSHMPEIIFKM